MISPSVTCRISENLYCLGPEMMPTYLLDGEAPVLFDAGMSVFGEHYVAEIGKILGERPLQYLFLSHVHFDHCGSAGFLKRTFPELLICASPVSAEIISKPSALELIDKLNTVPGMTDEQRFVPFGIDRVLEDGENVDLGGDTLIQALAAPGHTRDLTSFYLPRLRTLLPSEAAGGLSRDGRISSEFLVDYDDYYRSLNRLAGLPFERMLCAHGFFLDGEDATGYFAKAIEQTKRFRAWIEELLKKYHEDHEAVAGIIKAKEYVNLKGPRMPEAAYDLNLTAKIRVIARLQSAAD